LAKCNGVIDNAAPAELGTLSCKLLPKCKPYGLLCDRYISAKMNAVEWFDQKYQQYFMIAYPADRVSTEKGTINV
jgi:hypothetical protein